MNADLPRTKALLRLLRRVARACLRPLGNHMQAQEDENHPLQFEPTSGRFLRICPNLGNAIGVGPVGLLPTV